MCPILNTFSSFFPLFESFLFPLFVFRFLPPRTEIWTLNVRNPQMDWRQERDKKISKKERSRERKKFIVLEGIFFIARSPFTLLIFGASGLSLCGGVAARRRGKNWLSVKLERQGKYFPRQSSQCRSVCSCTLFAGPGILFFCYRCSSVFSLSLGLFWLLSQVFPLAWALFLERKERPQDGKLARCLFGWCCLQPPKVEGEWWDSSLSFCIAKIFGILPLFPPSTSGTIENKRILLPQISLSLCLSLSLSPPQKRKRTVNSRTLLLTRHETSLQHNLLLLSFPSIDDEAEARASDKTRLAQFQSCSRGVTIVFLSFARK